jgi:hypothetical protein
MKRTERKDEYISGRDYEELADSRIEGRFYWVRHIGGYLKRNQETDTKEERYWANFYDYFIDFCEEDGEGYRLAIHVIFAFS